MGHPSTTTIRYILAASGNKCAFPACSNPIFDVKNKALIGIMCHIKGNNKGSARYDAYQSE